MSIVEPWWVPVFYVACLLIIIYGLYCRKVGKIRGYWWELHRLVEREKEPETFRLYVGLTIGIPILVIVFLTLGVLFL